MTLWLFDFLTECLLKIFNFCSSYLVFLCFCFCNFHMYRVGQKKRSIRKMVIKSGVFTRLSPFLHSLHIIKTCRSRPNFIRIALLFRKILTNKGEHVKMGVNSWPILWLFCDFCINLSNNHQYSKSWLTRYGNCL